LDSIEIKSLRISFGDFIKIIDKAIENNKSVKIPTDLINQKNNNAKFLRWLKKHKLIELITIEKKPKSKKSNIHSRSRKIEIALQLKALELNISDIAKKFNITPSTVQGYFKTLEKYNSDYLKILNLLLKLKGISANTKLIEFPEFPINEKISLINDLLSPSDFKYFQKIMNNNIWIKKVVGQDLGYYDISLILPKK